MSSDERWGLVNLLAEPTRRRVYEAMRAADAPLTRDDVAASTGVSRRLSAFHLDVLAEAGLLTVTYARPPGRSGPGAGRPAKRYAAAPIELDVSVPARRYDIAARILARAMVDPTPGAAADRAIAIARDEGERIGELRRSGSRRLSVSDTLETTERVLTDLGYEPRCDGDGCVRLRNCPFDAVVDVAPQLVCGVNDAFVSGMLSGIRGHRSVTAALDGAPPDCCVTVARR